VLLFSESVEIENIVVNLLPSTKKRSAALDRDLNALWDEEVAEMTAKGRKIWNAELYRLENFQCIDTSLVLDLSTIEVKEIHAAHRLPGEGDLGESYRPNNIFVASFIETKDQKFIFGRTNTNTLNAGRIDLIGGSLSKTERPVVTGDDLFHSALSEIEEELNVPFSDVNSGYLCAILRTPRSYVGMIFHIRLNIDLAQFESRFRIRENDEITDAVVVDESELGSFLESQVSYLPSLRTLPFVTAAFS
jgi:8-oxo-dGTP pyrophosphatase MutT (NUDIX family)